MRPHLVVVDNGGWWSGTKLDPVELDVCGACGGAWFDPGEWTAYLERRAESLQNPPSLTPANRKLLDARVATCPKCSVTMERTARGKLTVDLCGACGGLWLDGGEYPLDKRVTWEERLARMLRD